MRLNQLLFVSSVIVWFREKRAYKASLRFLISHIPICINKAPNKANTIGEAITRKVSVSGVI